MSIYNSPRVKKLLGEECVNAVDEFLFSRECWDRTLGIAHINMVDVRTYSPLHHWFNDAITRKPTQAEPVYQFLMIIRERYGGIPFCDGSGLFRVYSKANHSCCFNMYASIVYSNAAKLTRRGNDLMSQHFLSQPSFSLIYL